MALNSVERHIQAGGLFTFKVAAGQTVKVGQLVEISGDQTVSLASADSKKVIGVVYSGTVGVDGVGTGYVGNNGDVVTVVSLRPIVYLTAGAAITAGSFIKAGTAGKAIAHADGGAYVAGEFKQVVGMAITAASGDGVTFLATLGN